MIDLLIAGDFKSLRKFWSEKMPGMPQPENDEQAEIAMHHARTMSDIPSSLRMWSHKWLEERGLPSALPENLKERAKRLEPKVFRTVGISIASSDPWFKPVAEAIQRKMETKVLEVFSENKEPSSEVIRELLDEVREKEILKLLG